MAPLARDPAHDGRRRGRPGSTSPRVPAELPSALSNWLVTYAKQRETFGKPIAEHQAIAFRIAEMGTKVEAAHLMMVNAARLKDSGGAQRCRRGYGEVSGE